MYFTHLNRYFSMNILSYLHQSMTSISRVNDSFYLQCIKIKTLHWTRMFTKINPIKVKHLKISLEHFRCLHSKNRWKQSQNHIKFIINNSHITEIKLSKKGLNWHLYTFCRFNKFLTHHILIAISIFLDITQSV